MNLWIRSQDKKRLLKCDCLKVEYQTAVIQTDLYKWHSEPIGWVIENNSILIGIYQTDTRALEVLNEIQEYIENQDKVTAMLNEDCEVVNEEYAKKVYQMPKE